MKLIVGLGNPGREYAGTRHNVGYDLVDLLANRFRWTAGAGGFDQQARTKFEALTMDGPASLPGGRSEKVLLLKPTTFMNLSGRSVQQAMAFYQLQPVDLLVALDDMALPTGKLRLRSGGSHGGHNGLRDIERALATSQYPRLRLGIDAPPPRIPARDYVLGALTPDQRSAFEPALQRAADAAVVWLASGINAAMNKFNAEPEETSSRRND